MAEKLSWTELRRALAARAGVSEKEAGAFLNAFSTQLTEALKSDKQVKVNGLGTFKLQAVAPRKSVNVSTGEEITIEGYNKIVFAPEAGVKELVESGKQKVESPAEIDPLKKLGEQAEEIVGLLGDLGQSPKEEPKPEPINEEPERQLVVEDPEPIIEEPEPEIVDGPEIQPVVEEPKPQPEKKKKNHFFRDVLICFVILLLLLFGAYFFFRAQLSNWIDQLVQQPETQPTTVVVEEPAPDPIVVEEPVTQEPVAQDPMAQKLQYAGLITEEPMHKASRLTWMAKRYYGSKIYWPYIYDANRDRFPNPNKIRIGTPIRVPELTAEQKDTTNAQTMANIEMLRKEAEAAMR